MGLITKPDDKDKYDTFSVRLPHILWIQHTFIQHLADFTSQRHQFNLFLSQTLSKLACKLVRHYRSGRTREGGLFRF